MTRTRTRIVLVVLFLVAVAIAAASVAGLASAGSDHSMTAVAKQATARFHNLDAAKAAGWNVEVVDVNGLSCIDNQPVGGMGVHYANPKLLGDAKLDPAQPEALVYAPNPAGQTRLAALEYIVFADAWTAAGNSDPPSLFGEPFFFTPSPNRFGLPPFWSLHLWIWEPNSAGLFQPWNPRVHC